MTSADVRGKLVYALRDDLVGPDGDDPRDADHLTEALASSPSHWYLTGFLAPTGQKTEDKEDETASEEIDSAIDNPDDGEPDASAARRPVFPSSIGLSVLVKRETKSLMVRVTYGTYAPVPAAGSEPPPSSEQVPKEGLPSVRGGEARAEADGSGRVVWKREPHEHVVSVGLDGSVKPVQLEGSGGVTLRFAIRPVAESELELKLVPPGSRYVTIYLVNERVPVEKPEQDSGFIFQAHVEVSCDDGFVPRPNLRGARKDDDLDERIGDLQYRDAFEYGVGHGVSVRASTSGDRVATCWVPTAEVEKVIAPEVPGVERRMQELAKIADGAALGQAVGPLVSAYRAWIDDEAKTKLDTEARRETAATLIASARVAADRIESGIGVLARDAVALEAFRIANDVMAEAQRQRERLKDPDAVRAGTFVPTWRPFQLAFLLMNVAAQVDPRHAEREAVDLIFFPTGGGKTEAYLGLAAFVLALRRLRHPGNASAGVTVLMRYTLRLLTLDQLERAATLLCALELRRRREPEKLGPHRFSVGLWVGKKATPNRFGTAKDYKDKTNARSRVLAFAKDPSANPSPIPIDKCPWCDAPFSNDTFRLLPDSDHPVQLRVRCMDPRCAFRATKEFSDGLPIVAVDEEVYRELPCFLIATVDKFAGLPWEGKTGLLLGRNVTHESSLGFYGPAEKPPDAKPLATPLLPPDLIIQDELHLISGPLGTMVGLYETSIDHLSTRTVGGHAVRPKIVASTATVRRALAQIRALFARSRVDVFPPPGPNRETTFFSEVVPASDANARLYVGLAAPGRSMKVLLMRSYIALLSAAKKAFDADPAAADPYMTLVGYFNSLRELGGSQRIVEDEVRARLFRQRLRRRVGEQSAHFVDRRIDYECVELTSRRTTDEVKVAKERLTQGFVDPKDKKRPPVDVALASNMISVGVDIQRLGLMVVCGQPKTTSEYIQATSRVGRDNRRPGLVLALLNVHKPRDRSHCEHFACYHESFYRGVEATSVTPFSPRAIDRGIAAVAVALARLADARLTPADAAQTIAAVRSNLGFIEDVLATRAEAHREGRPDDEPIDELKASLRQRVESLLDSWTCVVRNDPASAGLAYQKFEDSQSKRPLLRMPLDPELAACDQHERRFVANRSLRDVEGTTDVYAVKIKQDAVARSRAESET